MRDGILSFLWYISYEYFHKSKRANEIIGQKSLSFCIINSKSKLDAFLNFYFACKVHNSRHSFSWYILKQLLDIHICTANIEDNWSELTDNLTVFNVYLWTGSPDRVQKVWQKWSELGPNKGRGMFLNFVGNPLLKNN